MRAFLTAYLFLIAAAFTFAATRGWLVDAPFYVLPVVGPSLVSLVGVGALALGREVGSARFWEVWFHFAVARFAVGVLAWMLGDTLAGFDWSQVLAMGALRSVVVAVASVELLAVWLQAYRSPDVLAYPGAARQKIRAPDLGREADSHPQPR